MWLLKRLWRDEAGVVMSAEAVLLGTVGVLGAVAGLSTISHAVDGELKEVGIAIRSLDQSYGYCGHRSCCAWTAGSSYIQQDVETSIADLGAQSEADVKAFQERVEAYRKQTDSSSEKADPPAKKDMKKPKKKRTKQGATIDESQQPQPQPNDLPSEAPAKSPL